MRRAALAVDLHGRWLFQCAPLVEKLVDEGVECEDVQRPLWTYIEGD